MVSLKSSYRAAKKTNKDWMPFKEYFILLHITQRKPLNQVIEILKQEKGFKVNERQCKTQKKRWELTTYKKRNKKSFLSPDDNPPTDYQSSAVSSEVETDDNFVAASNSSAVCNRKGTTDHTIISDMAQDSHTASHQQCDATTSESATSTDAGGRLPSPDPYEPPTPASDKSWPKYWNQQSTNASMIASLPTLRAIPDDLVSSYGDHESMKATMASRFGTEVIESAGPTADGYNQSQEPSNSFGCSNKSAGTIDTTGPSLNDLIEEEYLRELF